MQRLVLVSQTILLVTTILLASDWRNAFSEPATGWNYRQLGAIEAACADTSGRRFSNPRVVAMCTGYYESEGVYPKCNGTIRCIIDEIYGVYRTNSGLR